jgi:hypothetical protein
MPANAFSPLEFLDESAIIIMVILFTMRLGSRYGGNKEMGKYDNGWFCFYIGIKLDPDPGSIRWKSASMETQTNLSPKFTAVHEAIKVIDKYDIQE